MSPWIRTIWNSQRKEKKRARFQYTGTYHKILILNASTTPPFDIKAKQPTEFYTTFLSKNSQFKAKDMILHRFHLDKVAFIPSASFIANLWNCYFFWTLLDRPSGVSIYYCPLTKQKLYLPNSVMDMVWMTQNFQSVISLCFGKHSLLATFHKEWANHMYENSLIYSSLYATNSSFFAKVLFSIDNALEINWRSCSNSDDCTSVNDRVLMMSDFQDSILRHSFIQQIPKSLSDKVLSNNE